VGAIGVADPNRFPIRTNELRRRSWWKGRLVGTGSPATRTSFFSNAGGCSPDSSLWAGSRQRFQMTVALVLLFLSTARPLHSREKDASQYGMGLIVNIPMPEAEVKQVVEEVATNGIIRGTKEYNKDEYVTGANAEASSSVFPRWTEGGTAFYKVRAHALDPRNFKDGGDVGTLAVRYVVQSQGDNNTVLRIDALFVEDFRHTVHSSNGSVETSEYKDIQDHLNAVELMKKQSAEAEKDREAQVAKKRELGLTGEAARAAMPHDTAGTMPARTDSPTEAVATEASPQTLEQHVRELRRQLERRVKWPGTPLKSAPFHTASTLKPLSPGTEVLIVVLTPYWYGVETTEGAHGWIPRDQLEPFP
jgi:hypothetical protein